VIQGGWDKGPPSDADDPEPCDLQPGPAEYRPSEHRRDAATYWIKGHRTARRIGWGGRATANGVNEVPAPLHSLYHAS
jgi:hypothetical protein